MIKAALAINNFAPVAQQNEVSPVEEEPTFIVTSQDVLEGQKYLLKIVQSQAHEIAGLNAKLEAIQKDMDSLAENQLIQLRLINDLRKSQEPQPLQKDRGEILRALLAANGGKMLAKDARLKMHLPDYAFSKLVKSMESEIGSKPYHLNGSQKILYLK